ncbi:MAG: hypothetical protein MPJ50_13760 [Pirellulales bacterium]|nr:hypothetical protein [Pirellulales bacterium]
METLQKQVGKVHRRLLVQHFVRVGSWSCFAAMCLTVFAALANWYWSWGLGPWTLLGSGLGAGLMAGVIWATFTRGNQLQAAIELDKRFGLKERVSSALALDERSLDSQAGRALKDDAIRRVKNLHVADQFNVSLNRWSALPLAPAVAVLLLAFLLPDITAKDADAETTELTPVERRELDTKLRELDKQLQEKIKQANKNPNLKDAADLFQKLEQDRQQLAKNKTADKKETMVKLNEMTKGLEDRKQQLEAQEKVKQQLSQIEGLNQGPADELAKSLKKGDFKSATQQLQQLADKIRQGDLSEKDTQALRKQLEEMQSKIDDLIKNQQQKEQNLQQQIDQARKSGDQQKAQQLQKQLDQMKASQQRQQQMMQKMAEKLGECAQCMASGKEGNGQKAADALAEMAGELSQMEYDPEELGMLSEMSQQMRNLRSQLSGMGMNGNRQGDGMGRGRGSGDRPEKETSTGFHDSQAATNQEGATGVVIGEVDGPNRKGEVREAIKNLVNQVESSSTDPLNNQKLNRATQDHVRDYFDKRNGRGNRP